MAIAYKVLGQSAPSATTEDDLYTAPALTEAIGSSIIICNRGGSATTFRVSVSLLGGATTNADYIYYDVAIPANDTFIATIGVTLSAGNVVRVYAGNGNLTFSLYGSEIA